MDNDCTRWQLSPDKAIEWANQIKQYLDRNRLLPAEASKLCGRIAFLNSRVYGKFGRALIRPVIWRQTQPFGRVTLTKRLRNSLLWFLIALTENWARTVPYVRLGPSSQVVIYSDAESNAHVGVVVLYGNKVWHGHGDIPNNLRRRLKQRKNNIMGYELIGAILVQGRDGVQREVNHSRMVIGPRDSGAGGGTQGAIM